MGHGFSKATSGSAVTTLSFDTLVWRYAYLKTLWDGVSRARAAGRTQPGGPRYRRSCTATDPSRSDA